jgi:type I restriction enzyme S subunit
MTAKPKTAPGLRFPGFDSCIEKLKVSDVAKVTSGATPSRQKAKYWNGSIPWVTTSLVGFNRIAAAGEFITEDGLKNSATKVFPRGTVIMALYGQGVTRGKVAILDIDAATNQACAAMLIKKGEIYSEFLFYELQRRYDELRNLSNDGSQKNLSGKLLKNISITVPTLPGQRQIADFLTAVDGRIGQLSQKKALLEDYKKGVMQQLFTQALRFKDDHGNEFPDWEEKTLGDVAKLISGQHLV